jgi:TRAP-type C4-dicarboxylate transport system permease small subunit
LRATAAAAATIRRATTGSAMRKALDVFYDVAGVVAALFMVGCLAMVLTSALGRVLQFHLRGVDAYAGYCMAGAGFLALAHTLKRGEHIRVTLFAERLAEQNRRAVELIAHLIGAFFAGVFAFFSARLVYQSYTLGDVSQGNDATPLWIPQLAMALGAFALFVAVVDELWSRLRGHHADSKNANLQLME